MHGHLIDCRSSLPELPSGPSERKVLGGSIMIFLFDTAQMSRKPQTSPLPVGVLAPVVVGTAWEELRRVNWPRPCPPWTQTSCETGIGDSGLLSDASLDSDAGGQGTAVPAAARQLFVEWMDGKSSNQDVTSRHGQQDTTQAGGHWSLTQLLGSWTDRGTSWEYTIPSYNISGPPALNSSLARVVLLLSDSDG